MNVAMDEGSKFVGAVAGAVECEPRGWPVSGRTRKYTSTFCVLMGEDSEGWARNVDEVAS